MRTLKKTLSLVLALVLCFGLVGTAFAGNFDKYTDAEDLGAVYAEAADLMIGLGIISGMSATELGAEGTLTREQAAKIVAYMVLGKNLADATTADVAPFKDVAADRWSAGYIAYCASKGILAGYGDGNFGPADELTGYQFAKMLLAALGYGKLNEFNPDSWALNTGILAFDLKVFAGDAAAATHDPITRQQAMLMAYNVLNKDIQAFDKTKDTYSPSGKKLGASFAATQQKTAKLGDGLNYTYWTVNDKAVTGNHLKDVAVATFAAGTTYKAIAAGLGITAASTKADATTFKNGAAQNDTVDLTTYVNETTKTVPAGSVLTVYKNAEAGATYKLAYTEAYLAKATVTKNTGANAAYDDVEFTVYAASDVTVKYDETKKIATGTYTNGAYYVVTLNDTAKDLLTIDVPASVEGKVTGTGTGYVRFGETKYNLATVYEAITALDYNTTTFVAYLNAAGEVIGYIKKADAPTAAPVYDGVLYVNAAQYSVTGASANLYGSVAYAASAKANVNFVGGAAQVIDLAVYTKYDSVTGLYDSTYVGKDDKGIKIADTKGVAKDLTDLKAGWYYYNTTAAGYVLTEIKDVAAADVTLEANNAVVIDKKYADANTVVNVYNYDATTKAAAQTTYTGIAGYPVTALKAVYKDTEALIVVNYVKDAKNNDTNLVKSIDIYTAVKSTPATTPVNYAYYKGAGEAYAKDTFFQGFYVNGAYVEYKIEKDASVTLKEKHLYNITLNNKGELKAAEEITLETAGVVEYVADTYVVIKGGAPIYLVAGAPVYNVATGHAGEADVIAVGDTITYAKGTDLNAAKLAVAYITVEAK